jgi:hypothetical protein
MTRRSPQLPARLVSTIEVLHQAGFDTGGMVGADCPVCGYPMATHEIALPGQPSEAELATQVGWIECAGHDTSCGRWRITRPAA